MRHTLKYIVLLITVFCSGTSFALANDPEVLVLSLDGEISAGTVRSVERSVRKAERVGAEMLVITLNTPGGLFKATEDISRILLGSQVPVTVYVEQPGGWAFSAGTYILLSADTAASHPHASVGAAQPVGFSGEPAGEKTEEVARSWMRTLAETTGRDASVAERFVTENLTLTGVQALEAGVVEMNAESLEDLLTRLELSGARMVMLEPSMLDDLLSFLSIPYLVPLFLSLGTLALFLAFRTGEFEIMGVVGVTFLLLGSWGFGAINLSVFGAALLTVGLFLLVFEFFATPGDFGVSGIIGAGMLFFGIAMFADEPFFPAFFDQPLFWLLFGLFVGLVIFLFALARLSYSALQTPVKTGAESLIGKEAVVTSALRPSGAVEIENERWPARLFDESAVLDVGKKVKVVKIVGNTIIGEPIDGRK